MNKKLGWLVVLAHIFYYIGIGMMIYLYWIDDNSPLWLGSILFMIAGILLSAMPDTMINVGLEGISISAVRWTMMLKYIVFMGTSLFLVRFFTVTGIAVVMIFGVDSFFAIKLAKEINAAQIDAKDFRRRMNEFEAPGINRVFKYIVAKIFCVLLFLSLHERVEEFVAMLLLNVAVALFTSEKILGNLEAVGKKEIWKCRIFLWLLEAMILFSVYGEARMITFGLLGTYYMFVTDITQERKTSVIKIRH